MERLELIANIDDMARRIIILSNHIGKDRKPRPSYVREKMNSTPSLDAYNKNLYSDIKIILKDEFGVDLDDAIKWHLREKEEEPSDVGQGRGLFDNTGLHDEVNRRLLKVLLRFKKLPVPDLITAGYESDFEWRVDNMSDEEVSEELAKIREKQQSRLICINCGLDDDSCGCDHPNLKKVDDNDRK